MNSEIDWEARPAKQECGEVDRARVVCDMKKLIWKEVVSEELRKMEDRGILWQGRSEVMNRRHCIHCH